MDNRFIHEASRQVVSYKLNVIVEKDIANWDQFNFSYWWCYDSLKSDIVEKSEIIRKCDFNEDFDSCYYIEFDDIEASNHVPMVHNDSYFDRSMVYKINNARHYLLVTARLPGETELSCNKICFEKDTSGQRKYGSYFIKSSYNEEDKEYRRKLFYTELHIIYSKKIDGTTLIEPTIRICKSNKYVEDQFAIYPKLLHEEKKQLEREWKKLEIERADLRKARQNFNLDKDIYERKMSDLCRNERYLEKDRDKLEYARRKFDINKQELVNMFTEIRSLLSEYNSTTFETARPIKRSIDQVPSEEDINSYNKRICEPDWDRMDR